MTRHQRGLGGHELVVHRHDLVSPTPLEGVGAVVGIGQIVLERAEQEGAQLALLAISAVKRVLREQVREEPLHQVLRVGGRVTTAAHERVEGWPVRLTKVAQGPLGGHGRLTFHGLHHHAPVRGMKRRAARLQGAWILSHGFLFG